MVAYIPVNIIMNFMMIDSKTMKYLQDTLELPIGGCYSSYYFVFKYNTILFTIILLLSLDSY